MKNRLKLCLALVFVCGLFVPETDAGYDVEITSLDFSYLDAYRQASTMTPDGASHLFTVSDGIYHWHHDGTRWRHDRIFEVENIYTIREIHALYACNALHLFILFPVDVSPQIIRMELRDAHWTVHPTDWGIQRIGQIDCVRSEDDRICCSILQNLDNDKNIAYVNEFDGNQWLLSPIPVSETRSRCRIASTQNTMHCFFVMDEFLQHARIENGEVMIEPILNFPFDFDIRIRSGTSNSLYAVIWSNSAQYGTYSPSNGWLWEDIPFPERPRSLDFVTQENDPLIIAEMRNATMLFDRDGSTWSTEELTKSAEVSDARLGEDGSIRVLLSGTAQAYWTYRSCTWTRDVVFSDFSSYQTMEIGFYDTDRPFLALLNPDGLIILHEINGKPDAEFVAFPDTLNARAFLFEIESPERFHALTWDPYGPLNMVYHAIDGHQISSEPISNVNLGVFGMCLDSYNRPIFTCIMDQSIYRLYKNDDQWSLYPVATFDGPILRPQVVEDPIRGMQFAFVTQLESGDQAVVSIQGWVTEVLPYETDDYVTALLLSTDRAGRAQILTSVHNDQSGNRTDYFRSGPGGWADSPFSEIPLDSSSGICIDRFDHPFLVGDDYPDHVMRCFWNAGSGWRSMDLSLPWNPAEEQFKHVISSNDRNGIWSAICTERRQVEFIHFRKTVPWFELFVRDPVVSSEDSLQLEYQLQNGETGASFIGIVILEVPVGDASYYYNIPSFSPLEHGLDPIEFNLQPGELLMGTLYSMIWPDTGDLSMNLGFWGVLLDRETLELRTEVVRADWGFLSRGY